MGQEKQTGAEVERNGRLEGRVNSKKTGVESQINVCREQFASLILVSRHVVFQFWKPRLIEVEMDVQRDVLYAETLL